jgi:hypothetical protein
MKLECFRHILERYSNIKFHENPSSGRRVVSYGRTEMSKLIVAFRNFANAPKIDKNCISTPVDFSTGFGEMVVLVLTKRLRGICG